MNKTANLSRKALLHTTAIDLQPGPQPPTTQPQPRPQQLTTQPLTVAILEASRISGLSRSEIYRKLTAGKLRAVKSGTRTLIVMDSLRELLASLPTATFKTPSGIN